MGQGLRERKRAALARQLAETTYALVQERGFGAFTVDDVVELAGVSRRTFSNYYSCKEEAVAAVMVHRAAEGLASWHHPAGPTPLVPAVRALVRHHMAAGTFASQVVISGLARDHHQLVPFLREAQWRLWSLAGARVLEELGETDPIRRGELTAIMGAIFAVVSSAVLPEGTAAGSPAADGQQDDRPAALEALVGHVLDRLETGFDS